LHLVGYIAEYEVTILCQQVGCRTEAVSHRHTTACREEMDVSPREGRDTLVLRESVRPHREYSTTFSTW